MDHYPTPHEPFGGSLDIFCHTFTSTLIWFTDDMPIPPEWEHVSIPLFRHSSVCSQTLHGLLRSINTSIFPSILSSRRSQSLSLCSWDAQWAVTVVSRDSTLLGRAFPLSQKITPPANRLARVTQTINRS
jgi:hypothetical protein